MYEQDPPYRKKVYDILSSNFEDFKTPEEEFYKKLDSDKGYAKKVYGVLASNFQDFSRPEDEFVSMLMPRKDNPFENQGPKPTGQQPGDPTSFPGGTQSQPKPTAKQQLIAPAFKNQGPEVSGTQPGNPTSFPGGETPKLADLEHSISESIGVNKLIDQNSKPQVLASGVMPAVFSIYPEQKAQFEQEAQKWDKAKKEQVKKSAPFLKSLEDAYIDSGEYKSDFTKDGIVDTYKLLRRAEDLSKTYGGGDAVKELIYNNLRKRAEYEQIKPEVNTEFEKLFKEKTGKDSKAFIQEKQAAQFAELSGLEKEIKNNFTLEQTRSKDIVNEKAKTIFQEKYAPGLQQVLAQYGQDSDEFKTALDEAQTNAARDLKEVTVNENKRLLRIRNELNAKMKSSLKLAKENSSLTPEEEKQFDEIYGQAYEKVQERKYNTKAAKDFVSTMDATGKAGAFLKSLWSGLNNSAASIGSGLVSMGLNNVVTDWARGLETTAKEYEVTDQPLKGENLLDPTTYLTRTGKQIGGTIPIIAMTALTRNPYVGGAIGFGFETIQGMGDVYNQAKSEGQSEEEAQKSAENFRQRNSMLLPLYFVESMGILEGLKGGFKKAIYSTGLEMAGELGTEIPQNFFQQQDSRNAKSFGDYLKDDAGQIAIETAIGVLGQGAAVSSLGEMTKAIGSNIRSAEKQQALNIIDQAGINAAFATIESQYQNGIIDEETLLGKKKALEQIQATLAGLDDMGVNQDGKKAYFEAVAQMSELNKKLQSTTDPVLRKIIEKQISEKQSEAQGIVDKTGTYAVITLPSGSSYSVLPSKVEETMNALKKQIGEGLVTVSAKGATEARGELTSKVNSLTKSYEESFSQQKQLQESKKEEGIKPEVKQEVAPEVTQEDPASQTETTPPGPEQTYTTKSGKYTVQYNNGARVVVDKSGNEVNQTSSGAKEALKQHAENYNYNFGERVNEQDFPQGIQSEEEADTWVAENTQSPIEAAEVYMRNQPQPIKLNTKEQMIADFGGFVTTEQSYRRHGDANNINNAKARAYFRKDAMPLDTKAKEMSDHYGVEITEQDLVDYMDRFPNGTEINKKFDNQARAAAKEKFEQLTGIPLTEKAANFALAQVATPEQVQSAEQDIFSMSDEDFYKEFYGAEDSTKNNEESGTGSEVQSNETGAAEGLTQNNEGQSDSQTSDEEDLKSLAERLGVNFEEEAPFKLGEKPGGFPEDFVGLDEIGIEQGDDIQTVLQKMIDYGGPFSDMLKLVQQLPGIGKVKFNLYKPGVSPYADRVIGLKMMANGGQFNWAALYIPSSVPGGPMVLLNGSNSINPYYDVTHELMHVLTKDHVVSGKLRSAVNKEKMAQLEKIYNFISDKKNQGDGENYDPKTYGLTNFDEFLAELMINAEFRDHIKDVFAANQEELNGKKLGTFAQFIQNIKDAIKEYFGKLFGKVKESKGLDFSKPLVDNAVDLMTDIFFTPEINTEQVEGAYVSSMDTAFIKGRANDIVKIAKKAQMAGVANDEIRAAIKSIDPTMSDDIVDNILKNAEKMNIYRPMKPAAEGVLPPLQERPKIDSKPKTFMSKVGDAVKRFFSSTGALPKEVRKFFEHRDGEMQAEYRNLKKTLDEYNKLSKKYKFTEQDKANIDKALRDLKPGKRELSSETGIVPFDAGVAAEGKMFTTPDNMLPAVIPDSLKALPEDVQEVVIQMRAQIDSLTKMAITSGFVTPEQALVLEENMGEYINRAYKLYSQKDWAEKLDPKVKEDARRYLANQALGEILALDPSMPLKDASDQAWKTAELRLNDILSRADVKTGISTSSNGRNTGILQRREDIPEPIRKLMGEYTDPAVSFAITVGKLTALNAHSKFLMNMRNFGMGTLFFEKNDELNRPADFNYQIAGEGSETWNPLNGLYTTKEIAESLKFNPESHGALYNGYMKFVGGVRWGKTVLSPITQAKNFESNLGFAVMNGHFRVDQFVKSFQYFAKSDKVSDLVDNLLKRGVLNQSVNLSELKSMLQDDTIHRLIRDAGEKKGSDLIMKVYDKLNKIYGASDNFWKVYTFMNEAEDIALIRHKKRYSELTADEKLTTDEEAADITKNVTPTYGRAWDGAKWLSKNSPLFGNFISFQIESVRTLGNTLNYIQKDLRDPNNRVKARGARRLAGVVLYSGIRYTALSAIAQLTGIGISGLMGAGNSDEEDEMLKAYNRLNIPFLLSSNTYWKYNAPGEYTVYDVSSLEPYNVAFKFFNAYTNGSQYYKKPGAAAAAIELLSPFIEPEMSFDVFMQWYNNEDDKGKPVFHEEDDFGKMAYDVAGHIFTKLSPSVYGLTKRLITGDNPANELYGFVGLRGYDVNVRNVMSRKLRERGERILSVEDDFYTKQYQGDPYAAAELANKRIKVIASELHKDYKAVLLAGGDPGEITKLIKKRGFKQGYQEDLKKAILTGNIDRLDKYFEPTKTAIKKWNETQAR